jgi:hypothetical protein
MTMTDEVGNAEHTLANLQQKREALVARGHRLGEERAKLAFAAHAEADAKARKRLDEINRESALHDSELRSLDAAIVEAGERLKAAQAIEQQAQAREVAAELLKRAALLVQHAQSLDDANAVRVEASCAIAETLTQMRSLADGLGVRVPSHEQYLALGSRADLTATMQTPFAREIGEHLPPNQRRTHVSYLAQWSDQIAKACAAVLGEPQKEKAA